LLDKDEEWAKEVLTQEELNNLLLTKDRDEGPPGTWQQSRAK
jgi:hypothetical protein